MDLLTQFFEGRTDQLTYNNDSLLVDVNRTIVGVDKSLTCTDHILINLDATPMTNNASNEIRNFDQNLGIVRVEEKPPRNSDFTIDQRESNGVSNERHTLNDRLTKGESSRMNGQSEGPSTPTEAKI